MKIRKLAVLLCAFTVLLSGCGTDAPAERPLSLGQISGGVYQNAYLNVRFAPEDWEIQNAGDLQSSLQDLSEDLRGTALEAQMEGLDQVMDLQAVSPDGLANVNILYTKMEAGERIDQLSLPEEKALADVIGQTDALKEGYEAAGITVSSVDQMQVTYGGDSRQALRILCTSEERELCILQIYERTLGSHSVVITATAGNEEEAAGILKMFEKLDPAV